MITATKKDKQIIINILMLAFEQNASVNYIVGTGIDRLARITYLMDYAFEICYRFGKALISEDRNACALVLFPDQKKFNLTTVWLDLLLTAKVVGFGGINKVLKREKMIKCQHPAGNFFYIWFIGVRPAHQSEGIGSKLLTEVLAMAAELARPVYLETSTLINIPWYEKFGFEVFHKLDLGYQLFFLRKQRN